MSVCAVVGAGREVEIVGAGGMLGGTSSCACFSFAASASERFVRAWGYAASAVEKSGRAR